MKKILITGASGFIGGFLVQEALKRNYSVYAGVRKNSNLEHLPVDAITIFEADLTNKNLLEEKFINIEKFDYIIHTAGVTKTCDKQLFDTVNVESTRNLIDSLIKTNKVPEKFVFISSLAAYGSGQNHVPIRLSDIPKPLSLYGKSKLKAETYITSLHDFPYLIFRPTGVYGPREKDYYVMYKSVNSGLETYIGSKEQHLSFIYVEDLVRLLMDACESNFVKKSYFASDLKNYTALTFNNLLKKELNKKTFQMVVPKFIVRLLAVLGEKISCLFTGNIPTLNTEKYKDISQKNWLCDSSNLVEDFNFQPEFDLEKGLHKTIEWYKKRKLL